MKKDLLYREKGLHFLRILNVFYCSGVGAEKVATSAIKCHTAQNAKSELRQEKHLNAMKT